MVIGRTRGGDRGHVLDRQLDKLAASGNVAVVRGTAPSSNRTLSR
jgi:hypothetical protein